MKYFLFLFLLFPLAAQATKLAVCDGKSYEVTITNGGQSRIVTLTPQSGSVEEYGPVVSFQLKGQKPVIIDNEWDEYCIWNGKIDIQQRNVGDGGGGGFGTR